MRSFETAACSCLRTVICYFRDQGEAMLELKIAMAHDNMGWMEFVSSLVASLAWPTAAIVVALVFHKQIETLLAKVKTLKWGEAAVDFATKLDKAEDEAETLTDHVGERPTLISVPPSERFQELLAISPNAAILDAWSQVDSQVRILGKYHGLTESPFRPTRIWDELVKTHALPIGIVKMLHEMRSMRNSAAHGAETTPTDALRFQELSQRVLALVHNSLPD